MNFDEYWHRLVHRVHTGKEVLRGNEEVFYRLSCIYGETMVDGIEAYFDQRFAEFDADMDDLRATGFSDVASDFRHARTLMFGDALLDEQTVQHIIFKLLEETEETRPVLDELDKIYRRLIPRLEALADYKYEFGVREKLYLRDEADEA